MKFYGKEWWKEARKTKGREDGKRRREKKRSPI